MLKMTKAKLDSNGVYVLTDKEIESFAYRQLSDYRKDYFKNPCALDVDDFVENYLKIKVNYYGLSLNKNIYGLTIIEDGVLPILDSENKAVCKEVRKGEVFVDAEACRDRETSIRFTLLHESAHAQFDLHVHLDEEQESQTIGDTYAELFGESKKHWLRTSRDWMEHHANRYAVYLLMPKRFVRTLWKERRARYFEGRRITAARPKRLWLVIRDIASQLGVAQSAIAYRLLDLNLISRDMFDSLNIEKWEVPK